MKIHEYQGKAILKKYGVTVPRGAMADSRDEAEAVARELSIVYGQLTSVNRNSRTMNALVARACLFLGLFSFRLSACRFPARSDDSAENAALFLQRLQLLWWKRTSLLQHLQPDL